jgi:hypothetical protein
MRIFLCVILSLLIYKSSYSQSLIFEFTNDDDDIIYSLSEIDKITYSESHINLEMVDASTISFDLQNIKLLKHVENPTITTAQKPYVINFKTFPNPSSKQLNVSYNLPISDYVIIEIIDMKGRRISKLFEGQLEIGFHSNLFDLNSNRDISAGLYVIQLITSKHSVSKTIVIENKQ